MNSHGSLESLRKSRLKVDRDYVYPVYFYAGFFRRAMAFLIDLLMISALKTLLIDLPLYFWNIPAISMDSIEYFLLEISVWSLYFTLLTKLTKGQTIGKMILGLRVVHIGYRELSWTTVLVREIFGRMILKVVPILYLTAIFNKQKQQFADLLCDTAVISEQMFAASEDGFVLRRKQRYEQTEEKMNSDVEEKRIEAHDEKMDEAEF